MDNLGKDVLFEIYKYVDSETLKSLCDCDKISYEILASKYFWSAYFELYNLPQITKQYNCPIDWIKYYEMINSCVVNTRDIVDDIIKNKEYILDIELIEHKKLLINNEKIDRIIKSTITGKNLDDAILSIRFNIFFGKIMLHYCFMFDKIEEDEDDKEGDEYGFNCGYAQRVQLPLFIDANELKIFIFNALYNEIHIKQINIKT